jgi:hypothetical protein
MKKFLAGFRRVGGLLRDDPDVRAFHLGRSSQLPEYYRRIYEKRLGRYASLLTRADQTPDLGQVASPAPPAVHAVRGGNPESLSVGIDSGLAEGSPAAGPQ